MSKCVSSMKAEWQWTYLGFSGVHRNTFYEAVRIPTIPLLLIKAVMLVIWIAFCNYSINLSLSEVWNPPWPCYLTNWTIVVNVIYLCVSLAVISHAKITKSSSTYTIVAVADKEGEKEKCDDKRVASNVCEAEKDTKSIPISCKTIWILHTIALDANLVVTVAFWALLYPYMPFERPLWSEICRHGMGLLYIYVERVFIAFPFRIMHCVYSLFFMLGYLILSLCLYLIGSPPPYPILDWENAPINSLATCSMIAVATLAAHFLNYFYSWLVSSHQARNKSGEKAVVLSPSKEEIALAKADSFQNAVM